MEKKWKENPWDLNASPLSHQHGFKSEEDNTSSSVDPSILLAVQCIVFHSQNILCLKKAINFLKPLTNAET